jgi:hypothetical protein
VTPKHGARTQEQNQHGQWNAVRGSLLRKFRFIPLSKEVHIEVRKRQMLRSHGPDCGNSCVLDGDIV